MATKDFYNPNTEKVVAYPEHFAALKSYLVPLDELDEKPDPCEDCHCDVPEDDEDDFEDETPENGEDMLD